MTEVVYEVVACVTLGRDDGDRVSLRPGARLKVDLEDHGFDERQFERAIAEGRLRRAPAAIAC
jgi:hypothetical protein